MENQPQFYDPAWTLAEKLERIKLLSPKRYYGFDVLADYVLRDLFENIEQTAVWTNSGAETEPKDR